MNFYTIYKITHIESGKFYIGRHITSNLDDGYMGSGKYVRHAIEKHGVDVFIKEYLFIFDNEHEMYSKEADLVTEEFCLREDTYNIAPGGFAGGWHYINSNGLANTKKQRSSARKLAIERNSSNSARVRDKQLVKHAFAAMQKKYPNGIWLGKKHTEETKKKISSSMISKQSGTRNSQYGLQWITNGVESTRIKKNDLIPEGWKKGRKLFL